MAGCAAEHHARKIGLRETRDTALKSGGRTKGIDNCLQGGGAGNSTVWVGSVGPFGDNGEEVGRYTHWVTLSDQGEASEAAKIRDIGDAWGGRRTGGSGETVCGDLHIETAGNLGSVGGATFLI